MGNKMVESLSALNTSSKEILPDVLLLNFTIVNACLIGKPGSNTNNWVLVDTGLENSADFIIKCAEKRFGQDSRPQAIILTHGHFDHVGSVKQLLELWDVPVYIHELEMPYVTGQKDYPIGDPTVDQGMVAQLSPTFPHTSIDLGLHAVALPEDGSVPGMPGWKWIHTPSHTEGHISLFRDSDRALIVADAFTTTDQESLTSVMAHEEEIGGPPKYLTPDWPAAEDSINILRDLNPSLAIPSHGEPISGNDLSKHLDLLVNNFNEIAKPENNLNV